MSGRCIMMCAGEYHPMKIDVRSDDWVVAVDGGLAYLLEAGIEPDFLLGDFDSIGENYRETVERFRKMGSDHFMQLPVIKDDTDTMAAARLGLSRGYREFLIYGGLGRRLDHTMANIQMLVHILRNGGSGWLLDRETSVTVAGEGIFRIPDAFEGTVSLFALDRELKGVTIRGMKYEIKNAAVRNDYPVGCSNETVSNGQNRGATIEIGDGTALIVLTKNLINKH